MDDWHRRAGAKFEHVGQWMRAWYYPEEGRDDARRGKPRGEAARTSAGLLDASRLVKLIFRARSAEFLNRVTLTHGASLALENVATV